MTSKQQTPETSSPEIFGPALDLRDDRQAQLERSVGFQECITARNETTETARELLRQNAMLIEGLTEAMRHLAIRPPPSGPQEEPIPQSDGQKTEVEVVS